MFSSLKNLQSAYQLTRLVAITAIVCSAIVVLITLNWSLTMIAREREKIYVLDGGRSLILALRQDMAQNRPVEARNHVKMFHELFFTLSPDAAAINSNIQRSLALADRSAFEIYNDLLERGFYNRIISANVIQTIVVDSIDIDFETYPHSSVVYSTQTIARQSNITQRSLVTAMELRNVQRSDNNPHGFLITNFRIVRNNEISRNINPHSD